MKWFVKYNHNGSGLGGSEKGLCNQIVDTDSISNWIECFIRKETEYANDNYERFVKSGGIPYSIPPIKVIDIVDIVKLS